MIIKKWILVKHFNGEPKKDDLKLVEEELSDELKQNEVLLEAVYLSVDPYMRPFSSHYNPPITMFGEQLSRVSKTKNSQFPVGTLVLSKVGWVSHYIASPEEAKSLEKITFDIGSTKLSYTLGILGMPGATAYIGLKLMDPKKGEILLLNGAAGAVGSIIGQLAKLKGINVIGFVGSDEKADWCHKELNFDHVFNYKKVNFSEAISKVAPNGVDMFFDNVGGEWYHTIINKNMNKFGRVIICGSIETYNDKETKHYPSTNWAILQKELIVTGFQINRFKNEWSEAFKEIKQYIEEGKLKVKETEYTGFDKMRDAFYGLFKGENYGKAIVKA